MVSMVSSVWASDRRRPRGFSELMSRFVEMRIVPLSLASRESSEKKKRCSLSGMEAMRS